MSEPAKPPLQLQPGRYYRADNNGIYGPLVQIGLDHLFSVEFAAYTWRQDGSPALTGGPRLLEEVPIDTSPAPLSLEEGGYYLTENKHVYGPLLQVSPETFHCSDCWWNPDGSPRIGIYPRLIRKVEKPAISSKESEEAHRGKFLGNGVPGKADPFWAAMDRIFGKPGETEPKDTPASASPNPDRSLLLTILTRSKKRLAFFEKEAADETWRFHEQDQGRCDELEGIIEEIENHLKKHK